MSVLTAALMKMASSWAIRLLTAEALEDLLLWMATKVTEHTETKLDDEGLAQLKKHLGVEEDDA